jgi:hypothetical protein|tara:strand:- start:107 stop:361 length:255 start_codon:yes stop_codon:yes gene_type:complete
MDEYLVKVEINNNIETLKTFSNSVEGAVDNMVKLKSVDKLFTILNTDTLETWEFEEDIKKLRELRKKIPNNIEMLFSFQKTKEE